jgi:hypothetical protein
LTKTAYCAQSEADQFSEDNSIVCGFYCTRSQFSCPEVETASDVQRAKKAKAVEDMERFVNMELEA